MVITAEMTKLINQSINWLIQLIDWLESISASDVILKIFQQSEEYIAIKHKLAEITQKFNFKGSNSQWSEIINLL